MTIHETMLSTFAEICAELAVRGGYTGAAVVSLTEQVCWENLFHEIRDRAEPVYAFDANGLLSAALKYRGQKLFDRNATQRCCGVSLPIPKKMTSWTQPDIWKCGCWRI